MSMPRSAAAGVLMLVCAQVSVAGGPALVFTEITDTAGIALTGELTESLAWGDYDNDGDEDLYLTVNGPNALFRNDGGGVFTDVTAAAGVGSALFSVGTAFGDLDNDGDLDLYVVNFGVGPDHLYRNNGDGTFTDIAATAGITDQSSSRGMAFTDLDGDGLLDIYVNAIGSDILYHNQSSMQFVNIAGNLDVGIAIASGQGVGVVNTDVNNDGRPDLFTGNRSFDTNWLFMNTSNGAPSYQAHGAPAGLTQTGLGMGVLSFDYDNDLDFDLYWTSWPSAANALYQNVDGSNFVNVAGATGTADVLGWGISCNAADIDNDGYEDFFVTNGFGSSTTPNVLFQNTGAGSFTDASVFLPGGVDFDGRGVAFADLDNDGDMDLCVTADAGEPNRLWRNDTPNPGSWIAFRLEGSCSNRSSVGARIDLEWATPGGPAFAVKEVSGGAGRGSFNSLPVEFGHTATALTSATIRWPSGTVRTINGADLALNAYNDLTEPLPADFAAPFGSLDFSDVLAFLVAFGAQDPSADMALPLGTFDFSDVVAFLAAFASGGCE